MEMNKRNRRLLFLACVLVLQLVTALSLLCYSARVKAYAIRNGRVIQLACKAYDPFSPFKGRYVRLTFDQSQIEESLLDEESKVIAQDSQNKKVFCLMKEGADGLWTVRAIRKKGMADIQKDEGIYIEGKCLYCRYDYYGNDKQVRTVHIGYSFDEYYMQENYARYVDKIHWDDFNALEPVLSLYVAKDGRCIQQGLTVVDGEERISIEEYCRKRL